MELTAQQQLVVDTCRARARAFRTLASNLEKAARLIECGVDCDPADFENRREIVEPLHGPHESSWRPEPVGHHRRAACEALRRDGA